MLNFYKGHSDWSHIARIKENPRIHIPIFGNGDIDSPEKAFGISPKIRGRWYYDRQSCHRLSLDFQRNQTFF
ncbi:hypothetical protein CCAN12_780021 [Capnocytophaga canimorsus]|uniref:DUS-like FMN-binding domain-containing protein n=1 Tax=Capnocytophaga canimorsus TaxID=28188 RepID=A0A0B7HK55_9FLAO|nr:hypothetical protein CCAN12_780021 [Capnocytophaga canimorsus]